MNNWHRKIWKLDPIAPDSFIAGLFAEGTASNRFWFEPFVDEGNTLRFKVEFKEGDMVDSWRARTLEPHGENPFSPTAALDEHTEQLEGTIGVGASTMPLHVYINSTDGTEELTLLVGDPSQIGAGGGLATAHNN